MPALWRRRTQGAAIEAVGRRRSVSIREVQGVPKKLRRDCRIVLRRGISLTAIAIINAGIAMTVAPTKDFVSIGTLASHARVTVRAIERAADELNIPPACRINFVPHYDGEQCEVLVRHINSKDQNR